MHAQPSTALISLPVSPALVSLYPCNQPPEMAAVVAESVGPQPDRSGLSLLASLLLGSGALDRFLDLIRAH